MIFIFLPKKKSLWKLFQSLDEIHFHYSNNKLIKKIFNTNFQAAPTRCDPDLDSGYTVGDTLDHS